MDQPAPPQRAASSSKPPGNSARGFPLFRVFGIQIRVDWSWLIVFFMFVILLRGQFSATTLRNQPDWAVWLLAGISVIALFACVLAHELGHSLVAIRHGIQMFDITLFIFGGMARLRGEPRSPPDELKIALAGPAVTVVLAAVFWGVWAYLTRATRLEQAAFGPLVLEGFRYLAWTNTALLVFNLIPGFPLDGGRVMRAILWRIKGNLLGATKIAAAVGKGFGMLLALSGFAVIYIGLKTGAGIPVVGIFNIFLGWFLGRAASESVRFMQLKDILEHFRVADAMQRRVITVSRDMTLDRLVQEAFYRYRFKCFPVADDGRFVGMIDIHQVQRVPSPQWSQVAVGALAEPATPAMAIAPDAGLYDAFRRMSEEDLGRLVVTDGEGRIVGLLSRRDIMNLLRIYSELHPVAAHWPTQAFRKAIPVAEPDGNYPAASPPATRAAQPLPEGQSGPPPSPAPQAEAPEAEPSADEPPEHRKD